MEEYYQPTIKEIYSSPKVIYKQSKFGTSIDMFTYRDDKKEIFIDLPSEVNLEHCIVKYIDKNDIEELGFKLKPKSIENPLYTALQTFKYDKWTLIFTDVFIANNSKPVTIKNHSKILFDGFVKNKYELETLLKFLYIKF